MSNNRNLGLFVFLICLCAIFLTWNLRQPVDYILQLRIVKLAALLIVGASIGMATVMFQTITNNRLLTPGIVGFDALFIFIQTMLVFIIGGAGYALLPPMPQFIIEALVLLVASLLLFGTVLRKEGHDILRLVLTGVIIGALFRGLSSFAQRLLNPSEFALVQQANFASFGAVDTQKLWLASIILLICFVLIWHIAPKLDVIALGRTKVQTLGLDCNHVAFLALAIISVLIAISTALVGPVTFLGLLAASLAHSVLKTYHHRALLTAAALIGASILTFGQFIFERLLGMESTLAVVIEFLGGIIFLILVLKRKRT